MSAPRMASTAAPSRWTVASEPPHPGIAKFTLAHDEDRPPGVLGDLLRRRAEQQAREFGAAAVADHNQIDAMPVRVVDQLLGGMADADFVMNLDTLRGHRCLELSQHAA